MTWVHLVTMLAVLQFLFFGFLVGVARTKYGVKAPATTGHPAFERYHRVHMNTLETLVFVLPSMWISAQYWAPLRSALLGALYLFGRQVYLQSYIGDPAKRSLGYLLSVLPGLIMSAVALFGIVRALWQTGGD